MNLIKEITKTNVDIARYYLMALDYHRITEEEVARLLESVAERYNEFVENAETPEGLSYLSRDISNYFKPMWEAASQKLINHSGSLQEGLDLTRSTTMERFKHPYKLDELETHLFESMLLIGPLNRQVPKVIISGMQFDLRMLFIAAQVYAQCGLLDHRDKSALEKTYGAAEPDVDEIINLSRDRVMDHFLTNMVEIHGVSSIAAYSYNLREFFIYLSHLDTHSPFTAETAYEFFSRLEEFKPFRFRKSDASKIIEGTAIMLAHLFDAKIVNQFVGSVFNLETLQYVYEPSTHPAYFTDSIRIRNEATLDAIASDFRKSLQSRVKTAKTTRTVANYIDYSYFATHEHKN